MQISLMNFTASADPHAARARLCDPGPADVARGGAREARVHASLRSARTPKLSLRNDGMNITNYF